MSLPNLISVENVSLHLGGQWILRDVSFEVQMGEFLAIIGPNGSGKSTLLKVLLGTLSPQAGAIRFVNEEMPSGSSFMGYVPQSRQIDPETPLRVRDFVSFGLPHKYRPWLTKTDRMRIQEALHLTDCESLAEKAVGELSGGQKQRVYLAQALTRNPRVLLLDEPTASLDPAAQEKIVELVNRISREKNVSILFVSHDINLVSRYAKRILYLTLGHHAVGTADEILSSPILSALYGTPIEVHRIGGDIVLISAKHGSLNNVDKFPLEHQEVEHAPV